MKTVQVTIRRQPWGNAALFFRNSNSRAEWLECYDPNEGHTEVSEAFYRRCKPLPIDASARAIAEYWESIGHDRCEVKIVQRLTRGGAA